MRKSIAIVVLCIAGITGKAQSYSGYNTDSVVTEAKKLYCARVAVNYANNWLQNQGSQWENNAGGSFSYGEDSGQKCIVFSNEEHPKVLATFYFSGKPAMEKIQVDTTFRLFTAYEQDMYSIKKQAQQQVSTNKLFHREVNTSWTIVPLIDQDSKRVYVFAGSQASGTVVFGNDYLLTYDENNQLFAARQLHQNTIPLNYRQDKDYDPITTVHSHSGCAASCLTATDICTVMLYEKCANWKKHMVISKTHVSVWDCEKDEMMTLTVKDWEKQYK